MKKWGDTICKAFFTFSARSETRATLNREGKSNLKVSKGNFRISDDGIFGSGVFLGSFLRTAKIRTSHSKIISNGIRLQEIPFDLYFGLTHRLSLTLLLSGSGACDDDKKILSAYFSVRRREFNQ